MKSHKLLSLVAFLGACTQSPSGGSPQTLIQRQLFVDDRGRPIDPYVVRQVKNTITANARDAQSCYNAFVESLGNKGEKTKALTDGEIHIDWTVLRSGTATQVRTVFSPFGNPAFEECLHKAIANWKFPPPDLDTYAEHRFRFALQASQPEPPNPNALLPNE